MPEDTPISFKSWSSYEKGDSRSGEYTPKQTSGLIRGLKRSIYATTPADFHGTIKTRTRKNRLSVKIVGRGVTDWRKYERGREFAPFLERYNYPLKYAI